MPRKSKNTAVIDPPAKPKHAIPTELPGTAAPETPDGPDPSTDSTLSVDPDQMAMFPGHDMQLIDIADIDQANNHRHLAAVDREKIQELAESIKACGLLQPIRVYLRADVRGPKYVIGYGYRRTAAHILLGRTQILAQVFPSAPAWEIQQARATENLARQDLDPMEEMTAVVQLVAACDGDADVAAGKIGKSRKWVQDRLYLDRLDPKIRQLIHEKKINMGHAREIAKLHDRAIQVGLVEWIIGFHELASGTPDEFFRDQVSRRMRQLKDASWDLSLPIANKQACDTCPHNSANDLALFELDTNDKSPAMCANQACYVAKQKVTDALMTQAVKSVAGDVVDGKLSIKVAREKAPEGLRPEALVKEVKREASPAFGTRKKKETAEEKRQRIAKQKLQTATAQWQQARKQEICDAINHTPQRRIVLEIFDHCPSLSGQLDAWGNKKGTLDKQGEKLFASLLNFDVGSILAIGVDLQADTDFYHGMEHLAPAIRDRLFDAMGIPDEKPAPKLEDFLPPPEAEKPAAVKKTKQAKAGKTPKSNKPGKPTRKGKAAAAGDYLDDAEGGEA